VQYGAALVFAVASHNRVQSLMEDLAKRFPEDTIVQFIYLPTIQAQLALNRDNAADAISLLQAATPFELGSTGISTSFTSALYPIFVRGNAYLAARHGSEAAAEFQKILQWRGVVGNEPIGVLAYLGLARQLNAGQHFQCKIGLSGFPHALESS
jgi:eukaryotic-like serine/threonine-protein kinase